MGIVLSLVSTTCTKQEISLTLARNDRVSPTKGNPMLPGGRGALQVGSLLMIMYSCQRRVTSHASNDVTAKVLQVSSRVNKMVVDI